jgi:lantibiotic modifying enzyme
MSTQTFDITVTALRAAERIGRNLCETAFWDEGRGLCTWMSRTDVEDASGAGLAAAVAALGPQLYSGTAGVSLFLGELYGLTGDEDARRTAEGALRRTLAYLHKRETQTSALSFYLSHLGAAYVIARFHDLDLCRDLSEEAAWLLDEAARALEGEHLLDTLGGTAGAVPALLWMHGRPGFERSLEVARACGEELCRRAARSGETCAWEATEASGPSFVSPPLTGLSHGACGMGLALFELYAATGDEKFLRTARGAFAYEDALFSPAAGNWIDVRFPYADYGGGPAGTAQATWCHGAPGIALTRARAARLDPARAEAHTAAARAGVNATMAAVSQNLQTPNFDATLCHGLAGLSEILLICGRLLGDENCLEAARTVAAELIRRYDESGQWPSGIQTGGANPMFMIGTSGVGHHFLRLHSPDTVPPVLIVQKT